MFFVWFWGVFPGNFLSRTLAEGLLWRTSLTRVQMSILETPVEIAINAAVWLGFARLFALLRRRAVAAKTTHN